jgi:adenine/guanine phosphoribosyltransferase-like PRPP-binding protein
MQKGVDFTEERPIASEASLSAETIEHPEIAELAEPVSRILEALRSELERGTYPLIIGIDDSGRIPALLIAETLTRIYEKLGIPKPQILFFPSYGTLPKAEQVSIGRLQAEKLQQFLAQRNVVLTDKKVLIVDDAFKSGKSIQTMVLMLHELKLASDVAVMGLMQNNEAMQLSAENSKIASPNSGEVAVRVLAGKQGNVGVYRNRVLSGVRKTYGPHTQGFVRTYQAGVKAIKAKSLDSPEGMEAWVNFQEHYGDGSELLKAINTGGVARARQDIKILAGRLAETFEKKSVPQ